MEFPNRYASDDSINQFDVGRNSIQAYDQFKCRTCRSNWNDCYGSVVADDGCAITEGCGF